VSNEYRKGDIRHCYADTTKAQKLQNFKPTINLQNGLAELADWVNTRGLDVADFFEKALKELRDKHLAT
jgi:dTDP-L-rhamnose 4-epimerase